MLIPKLVLDMVVGKLLLFILASALCFVLFCYSLKMSSLSENV